MCLNYLSRKISVPLKQNKYIIYTHFQQKQLYFLLLLPFLMWINSWRKEFTLLGTNSFLQAQTFLRRVSWSKEVNNSYKLLPLEKMAEKYGGVLIHLNPIALRKAKIAYNFGLSECNRVNTTVF